MDAVRCQSNRRARVKPVARSDGSVASAAISANERLTYRELNERADTLAGTLQELGIGPDVPVGVCIEPSLETMVGLLAILKAGRCYVPLDPAYPQNRLAFVLADAQPPVLLTQSSLREDLNLDLLNLKLLCVDEPNRTPGLLSHEAGNTDHASARLAYIIYTSGSTGKPKGVMITHRNVANLFAGMDRLLGSEPGVWLAVTSLSFDISVLELFWTLARGYTVVIHLEGARARPERKVIEQAFDGVFLSPLRGASDVFGSPARQEVISAANNHPFPITSLSTASRTCNARLRLQQTSFALPVRLKPSGSFANSWSAAKRFRRSWLRNCAIFCEVNCSTCTAPPKLPSGRQHRSWAK